MTCQYWRDFWTAFDREVNPKANWDAEKAWIEQRIRQSKPLTGEYFKRLWEWLDKACELQDMDWSAQKRWIEDKVNRAKSIPIRGQVKS